MEPKKLIVVIGPTASNKTTLAHQIALKFGGEIINGDVFQMYKDLHAGVNKPSDQQQKQVSYHLINQLQLNDNYSICDYQHDFNNTYEIINSNNHPVILCGGSHLYLDAVIRGYDLSNQDIQDKYASLNDWTNQQLWDYLNKYDSISASKCINNKHRLQRAVAYLLAHNNQPKSQMEQVNNKPCYQTLIIMTTKPRDELYKKINARCEAFFANDKWIEEVKKLYELYGEKLLTFHGFRAIGYREVYNYVVNQINLDIATIQQKTRHLAKHQYTWCKNKFPNKIIFNYGCDDLESLFQTIQVFLND